MEIIKLVFPKYYFPFVKILEFNLIIAAEFHPEFVEDKTENTASAGLLPLKTFIYFQTNCSHSVCDPAESIRKGMIYFETINGCSPTTYMNTRLHSSTF